MANILLKTNVWHGDNALELPVPEQWNISYFSSDITACDISESMYAIQHPIESDPLQSIARGKRNAVIVVDDLTRPTPVLELLPIILNELYSAGIDKKQITILIATGTHRSPSNAEMAKKVGEHILNEHALQVHSAYENLVYVGKTRRGTPVHVNKTALDADLCIGVGIIYPHPVAGFSGGAKIVAPGICGFDTIRHLHDAVPGARERGGSTTMPFREEISEIAGLIGLDFIVNAVINDERQVCGVFAGNINAAFNAGVEYYRKNFTISNPYDCDVLILNAYPFDTSLTFVADRALWPLYNAHTSTQIVVVGGCSEGVGDHELYPVKRSLRQRITRRLKHLSFGDFSRILNMCYSIQRMCLRKKWQFMLLSSSVTQQELSACFPRSRVYSSWDEIVSHLSPLTQTTPVKVSVLSAAPLYLINLRGPQFS